MSMTFFFYERSVIAVFLNSYFHEKSRSRLKNKIKEKGFSLNFRLIFERASDWAGQCHKQSRERE